MTRGLIVLHPYATQIITGDKTEEYRDRPPPPGVIGSTIYLLSGGYALGRIKITWAEPGIWHVRVVERFDTPRKYEHPNGAQVWVRDVRFDPQPTLDGRNAS